VRRHASTKGCSRESSDVQQREAPTPRGRGLNEGLLSREQRPARERLAPVHVSLASTKGCSRESSDQVAGESAALALLDEASTKGCSRESSDCRRPSPPTTHTARLNEGLLSREQRPAGEQLHTERWAASTKGCSRESSD